MLSTSQSETTKEMMMMMMMMKKKKRMTTDMLFTRQICSEPGSVLVWSKCLDKYIWFAPKFWNGPAWPATLPRTWSGPNLVPILIRYKYSV